MIEPELAFNRIKTIIIKIKLIKNRNAENYDIPKNKYKSLI